MGPACCPEKSVKDYHSTLRYKPEERSSQLIDHFNKKDKLCKTYGLEVINTVVR
jgi:hypothetical protein